MNIKDILEKIAKSLKHPLDIDNNSLYDEKNPHVIIPKTEQETRDDYLKSYTSLFETYKFPDIEEVLEIKDKNTKEIWIALLKCFKNEDNQVVGSDGSIYTKTNIIITAQSILPQLLKLNKLGLANINVDEDTKNSLEKYAEYFLYSDDLISKSTGVYTLQDARDFIVIIDDITKNLETVFKNADLGQTYTFDYSNFIHNLNACRTNIESLYQKAYAEAEKSINFNNPNDSVDNHLSDIVFSETDSSLIKTHINSFVSMCETKKNDFSRLVNVLKSRELLSPKEIATYLFEFGNISANPDDLSSEFMILHKITAMLLNASPALSDIESLKKSTNRYLYTKIDTEAFSVLQTVIKNTTFTNSKFIEPLKDLFNTSSSSVIDMPKFILTIRLHLMNNPIFNSILTSKNLSTENFEMLATKENLLTLMGCVCEALNDYYQNSPLSVHTNFKFNISQEYPAKMESVPLASLSNTLNTYTLNIFENSIDKLIEKYKDDPIYLFEFVVTSIIHEFGHYADLVSNLTVSNNSTNQEENKSSNILSNLDFSTMFLLTLISPSIQQYLDSNEVYKAASEENKLKYIYVLVNDLKNILNYNEYADNKKEMFARYFSFESMEMLLDLLKVTPTVNPENVELLKKQLHESSSIISSSKQFQIESNKARELLKKLSEELSSVIKPIYLSRLLTKWANIPAYNLHFGKFVDPVSISEFDKKSKQLLEDYIKSLSPDQVYELAIESIHEKCPELFDFICKHIEPFNHTMIETNKNNDLIFTKIDELVKMLDEAMSLENQSVSMEQVCNFVHNQIVELNISNPVAEKYLTQISKLTGEAKKCDAAKFDKELMMRAIYEKLIISLANLDDELYKQTPPIIKIYNHVNEDIEPIIKLVEERANDDEKGLSAHNIDFVNCKIFECMTEEILKDLFDYFIKTQNVNALYLITSNIYNQKSNFDIPHNKRDSINLEYYAKELMDLPKSKKLSETYIDSLNSIWFCISTEKELADTVYQEIKTLRSELRKMNKHINETYFKSSKPLLTEGIQNSNEQN